MNSNEDITLSVNEDMKWVAGDGISVSPFAIEFMTKFKLGPYANKLSYIIDDFTCQDVYAADGHISGIEVSLS